MLNKLMSVYFPELYRQNLVLVRQKLVNDLWRKENKHNETQLKYSVYTPLEGTIIKAGRGTYGVIDIYSYRSSNEGLLIGDFVSIGKNTKFILGGEHYSSTFSTYPFKKKKMGLKDEESFSKGMIIVEDDVWIGQDVTILSGVTLSRGTIVGAGSVVAKSTEPYSIVVGNPARMVRLRFSKGFITELESVDFKNISDDFIRKHINKLYSQNTEDINYIIQKLNEKN